MSGKGDIAEIEKTNKAMQHEEKPKVDRISALPSCILLYIMTFITTKEAVQTCVLSKRWKNLWKKVPTLTIRNADFQLDEAIKNFVHQVLLHRDNSSPLYNVDVDHARYLHSEILGKLVRYATSHGGEKIKIDVSVCGFMGRIIMFYPSMLSCHSLKYLNLSLHGAMGTIVFPPTLDLPELQHCHLKEVAFSSSNNDRANPFSGCKKLTNLVIDDCNLYNAKVLCVSGDKLSNLIMEFGIVTFTSYKVQVSAPNLKSFTYMGQLTTSISTPQLIENNLDFLEEATVEILLYENSSNVGCVLKSWLEKFGKAKSLTLSVGSLEALALMPDLPNTEPIAFGSLKYLNVKKVAGMRVPNQVLKYLLQNAPNVEKVTIIEVTMASPQGPLRGTPGLIQCIC